MNTREALQRAVIAVAGVALLAVLWPREATTPAERAAVAEGRTIITYWDRSQGFEHDERNKLIDEFNASQDEIYVRTLSIGWRIEKLLTAISSGAPPDICSLDANTLATLGYQGCFMDLTDFMEGHAYLHPGRFFEHTIDSVTINGRLYGIPTMNDSYCLVWNKAIFRRAGLDPDRPPRTLEELEAYAAQLTTYDENGTIKTIGFLPWIPWDMTHMWGVLFGGTWYDPARDEFVPDLDPRLIAALEWQGSWQLDPDDPDPPPYALPQSDIDTFFAGSAGGGGYQSAQNPFYTGRVAMSLEGEWQCTFIPRFAPELDWGVAPMPQPEGAPPRSYSPGCVLDCIPAGSPNPEAAMKFFYWFYSPRPDGRPSPASDYNKAIHNVPPRKDECMQPRFIDDPKFSVFVKALLDKPTQPFPTTPATQYFVDRVYQSRERVLYGGYAAEEAIREVHEKANAELRRKRAQLERLSR